MVDILRNIVLLLIGAIKLLKGGNIINSGGGMGLTSKDYLVKVIEYNGALTI